MCGIYSIYSKENINIKSFFESLKELEYRGYDSAGVALVVGSRLKVFKTTSKIKSLEPKLKKDIKTSLILGHTRWATHGTPSILNCHPHYHNGLYLVHNGIVENYDELRKTRYVGNAKLLTETDSELIACMISYFYKTTHSLSKSVNKVGRILKGSNSFLCIDENNLGTLVAYKNKTPLFFGLKDNGSYAFSSDLNAMKENLNKYLSLENNQIIEIKNNICTLFDNSYEPIDKLLVPYKSEVSKSLKNKISKDSITYNEIKSQSKLIPEFFDSFPGVFKQIKNIKKPKNIVIIGCGSSFNSAMLGKLYFEKVSNIPTEIFRPSEFTFFKDNKKTLYIFLSQSGETADICDLLESNKEYFSNSLSIVNNFDSRLVNGTKNYVNLDLGIEKGVAATKTFIGQLVALYLISSYFNGQTSINTNTFKKAFRSFFSVEKDIKKIAKLFFRYKSFYILGRNYTYPIALEGALKIKEISYIHCEALLSSEMKHGPIALLDKNFPILYFISTDKTTILKEISNLYEIKTRTNNIVLFASSSILNKLGKKFLDEINYIKIPDTQSELVPIFFTLSIQFLSFYFAKLKKIPVDQPRNLAKVVTVA